MAGNEEEVWTLPKHGSLIQFFLLGHDYPAGDQRKDTGRFMVTNGLEQGEYNGSTLGRMAARDDWDNSTVQQRWLPDWFK